MSRVATADAAGGRRDAEWASLRPEAAAWHSAWEAYGRPRSSASRAAERAGTPGDSAQPAAQQLPATQPRPSPSPAPAWPWELNRQRARVDLLVAIPILVAFSIKIYPLRGAIPLLGWVHHLAMAAAAAALWPLRGSTAYVRWREPVVATLRLCFLTGWVQHVLALSIGSHLVGQGSAPSGVVGIAASLAGLIWVSHSFRLALLGLGLPLCAPAHAAFQLLLLLLARRQNDETCAAVLTADEALALSGALRGSGRGSPMAAPGSSSAGGTGPSGSEGYCSWGEPPQCAAFSPAAAQMMASCYTTVSTLAAWLRPLLPLPRPLGPFQQCRVLFSCFQLTIGLLLPVAVHFVLESRAYVHCQQQLQQQQQQREQGGNGSGSRQPGRRRQRQEQRQPADQACSAGPWMGPAYEAVWWAVEHMPPPALALVGLVVVAAIWELAVALA